MKFHPALLIYAGVLAVIAAGAALAYMAMPEKASIIRLDADRHAPSVSLRITSLEAERPFDWEAASGGGRRRTVWKLNSYDASRLRIVCRDEFGEERTYDRDLTPGPSRLVTISTSGCGYIETRSSPLPGL